MKKLKENLAYLILCLCEMVVGILLLIKPVAFTRGIIIAFGILLTAAGIFSIIRYIREIPVLAAKQQTLTKGLIGMVTGLFCALQSRWFIKTFPILTILYGVIILFTGAYKIQSSVDIKRLKKKNFVSSCISAGFSVLFAVVILWNPFGSSSVRWILIGVFLIVEAVLDLFIVFGNEKTVVGALKKEGKGDTMSEDISLSEESQAHESE